MQINTYLTFDGNCRAAFKFYAQLLGGDIKDMMTVSESEACSHFSADMQDLIMHASIDINGVVLMGSDAMPQHPFHPVRGAHIVLNVDDPAKAEWLFAALAENGSIDMPMEETFFAQRYGIATDRFGVPWMVNCPPKA